MIIPYVLNYLEMDIFSTHRFTSDSGWGVFSC